MDQGKEFKEKSIREEGSPAQNNSSIENLLQERKKIDDLLKEKYARHVTVMFTDIKGSTSFFDARGDIEGRLMVQKHNDMLFPIIRQSQGRVIKTIGDAIMAAFENPVMAVQAAITMQQTLFAHNQDKQSDEQIHIRIGINSGEGLVESQDIFGDVVNVAARVESLTEPDQILISAPVYDEVRKTDDIICRYVDVAKIRGKEEAIEVYRVVWGDEEIITGVTRASTTSSAPIQKKKKQLRARLEMDITREGNNLKIIAIERIQREASTLRPYEEMHVSMPKIEKRCQEVISLLNRANTRGQVSKDILAKLRDVGLVLFDNLLTARAKEIIRATQVQDLVFNIDDTLVQIPWELLYDGEQFLCQKFNIGRIVKTKREIFTIKTRIMSRPLKMLIMTDPCGDLKNAFEEGRLIREEIDKNPAYINANQRSGQINVDYIMEKLRNFDIVHYAGHADYDAEDPSNSGWLFEGGKFTSADIMKLISGRPMPALVFCNACQSGQTGEWKLGPSYSKEIYGLANAFLLAGVQHYVGTFWEVLDEPSAIFALEFYRAMMNGQPIGEAMRTARLILIRRYGEDTIVWASYMLYGDPASNYFDFEEMAAEDVGDLPSEALREAGHLRSTPTETVSFDETRTLKVKKVKVILGAFFLMLLFISLFFFFQRQTTKDLQSDPYFLSYSLLHTNQPEKAREGFETLPLGDARRYEGLAAVFFKLGDYDQAFELSNKALELEPQSIYAHVIRGNILFTQDKLSEAEKEYEMATQKNRGASWQRAEAFNNLGRIYSSQSDLEKSIECYEKAAILDPGNATIYTNHGMAMQKMGNIKESFALYQKAARVNPQDPFALSLLAETERRKELAADKSRQAKIDKRISELISSFKNNPPEARAGQESWTSKPITISFLNFRHKGRPSMREGEDEFFLLKVSSLLQENGRIQVVERQLLDKLLEELNLSSTDLVDPQMALKVGRILAARLIATGSMMRYGKDIQISLRLTETETTALKGAIIETDNDLDTVAKKTALQIIEKLSAAYPLRATITALEGNQVVLDLGFDDGLRKGLEFKVLAEENLPNEKAAAVHHRQIGTIQIASTRNNTSYATIVEQSQGFQKGMKVEAINR